MDYKYSDYVEGNAAVHSYDYDLLNKLDPDNHTDDVIRWVERKLSEAISNAQNVRGIDITVPKYAHWKKTILKFLEPKTEKNDRNWGLVCAAYGYAIEEYVNLEINSGSYPYPHEFDVKVQCRTGGTIPDVKIFLKQYDEDGNLNIIEVAWLDITSGKSICHIHKKKGRGWDSMPIVAEIVYPPLEIGNLIL